MPLDHPMNFSHADGFFSPERARPATLFGAGAVGSYTALGLVKAGFHDLTVWDHDHVASENTPMSLFGPADFAKAKVDALQEIIERLTGVRIKTRAERYEDERIDTPVVVSCVDDMPTRGRIWKNIRRRIGPEVFCDTRLGYAYVEVLTVRPNLREDIDRYEKLFFANEDAVAQTCGHHGVVYASMYAASAAVAAITAHLASSEPPPWRVAQRCDTLQRVF